MTVLDGTNATFRLPMVHRPAECRTLVNGLEAVLRH
jgi:hypothetical protein